ncbi:hypothetical protein IRJ41_008538 [Triplophysa rosa]|uniref:Ig-like domain-containing protein n=1 Tax=Triplophysa rosa TaxID=992332 RepID=A0A9W7TXN8_TRIRA|nr:hypothetical protein IRJ41_008538 [Triplophysa rosa]
MLPNLLYLIICLVHLASGEKAKLTVTQTPQDLITYGGSLEISCSHNIPNYDRLLWYTQSKAKELIFMGYLLGENGYPEEVFQKKIKIHGNANKYEGFLTVYNLTLEHSAIYFCAAYYTSLFTQERNMFALLLFLLLPSLDLGLKQSSDLFITEGFNVTLNCSQIGTSHNSMYWFRQRPAGSLEPIVYSYVKAATWEKDFKDRASTVRNGASLDLTLYKLQSSDTAMYYCAKQDAHQCSPTYNLNKNL